MQVYESATISIEAQLEHGSSVVTLSVEGAKAILDAKAMLQRLYDNAQAIGGDSPIGWQIDTLDYQALENFLYADDAEAAQ